MHFMWMMMLVTFYAEEVNWYLILMPTQAITVNAPCVLSACTLGMSHWATEPLHSYYFYFSQKKTGAQRCWLSFPRLSVAMAGADIQCQAWLDIQQVKRCKDILTFFQRRWTGSGYTWGKLCGLGTGKRDWRIECWCRRSYGSTLWWGSSGLWMGPN